MRNETNISAGACKLLEAGMPSLVPYATWDSGVPEPARRIAEKTAKAPRTLTRKQRREAKGTGRLPIKLTQGEPVEISNYGGDAEGLLFTFNPNA